jgi:hypothetical protein
MGEIRIHEIPCRHQLMTEPVSLARIGSVLAIELEQYAGKDATKRQTLLKTKPQHMRASIHSGPHSSMCRVGGALLIQATVARDREPCCLQRKFTLFLQLPLCT